MSPVVKTLVYKSSIAVTIKNVSEFPETGLLTQLNTKKVNFDEIEKKKKADAEALPTKGKPTMFFYVKPNVNGADGIPSHE